MNYLAAENRYDAMTYRRTGKSGLMLPAISLGLWHNFGGVDTLENMRAIIWRAFDLGITHFDLANNYGPPPGSAEENFGRIFAEDLRSYRDELVISTKAGYRMWPGPYGDLGSRKYLLSSLDASLKRMGLEYVDIFYSHRPDLDTPLEETMGALASAVHGGKAIYPGISNYAPDRTAAAAKLLRELGTPLLIHQPNYNIFNRTIEGGLLAVLAEQGVGCIVFSPLAQGMLTSRYLNGIPADSRAAKPHGFLKPNQLTDERMDQIKKLNAIAENRGQTLAEMAVAWILRHEGMTSALVGASSVKQLEDNVAALNKLDFSADELSAIDAVAPGPQ